MPERLLNISRFVILGTLAVTTLALFVVVGVSSLQGTGSLRTQLLDGEEVVMEFPDQVSTGDLLSSSFEEEAAEDVTFDLDNISEAAWNELKDVSQDPASVTVKARSEFDQFLNQFGSALGLAADFQTALLNMYTELGKASQPETQPL